MNPVHVCSTVYFFNKITFKIKENKFGVFQHFYYFSSDQFLYTWLRIQQNQNKIPFLQNSLEIKQADNQNVFPLQSVCTMINTNLH